MTPSPLAVRPVDPPDDAAATGRSAAAPASPVRRVSWPLVARSLVVEQVTELGPHLRRVELGGPDLDGFASHGPADHVKVFFPDGADEPTMPVLEGGRWVDRDDPTLVYRDYTVRRSDPASGGLALEMVVGEHGPAARWAGRARPGDRLGVLGPRGSAIPPTDRAWYLLAADETGLPALTNWLELLPPTAAVQAFVEVGTAADEIPLPVGPRSRVTWLHRRDAAPGTTTLLADAVAGAPLGTPGSAPEGPVGGDGWCWAGAEASAVRAIRGHLSSRGLDRSSFSMSGYWRRGEANFDHHSPDA